MSWCGTFSFPTLALFEPTHYINIVRISYFRLRKLVIIFYAYAVHLLYGGEALTAHVYDQWSVIHRDLMGSRHLDHLHDFTQGLRRKMTLTSCIHAQCISLKGVLNHYLTCLLVGSDSDTRNTHVSVLISSVPRLKLLNVGLLLFPPLLWIEPSHCFDV